MTDLQRRALATVPLLKESVQAIYEDAFRGNSTKHQLRILCESHERLRAELEGCEKLLRDSEARK